MSTRKLLVSLSERDMRKMIIQNGWSEERNNGSHIIYGFPGRKDKIALPRHKHLAPGIIRKITEQLNGNTHVILKSSQNVSSY